MRQVLRGEDAARPQDERVTYLFPVRRSAAGKRRVSDDERALPRERPFCLVGTGRERLALEKGKTRGSDAAPPGPGQAGWPRFFREMPARRVWDAERFKLKMLHRACQPMCCVFWGKGECPRSATMPARFLRRLTGTVLRVAIRSFLPPQASPLPQRVLSGDATGIRGEPALKGRGMPSTCCACPT